MDQSLDQIFLRNTSNFSGSDKKLDFMKHFFVFKVNVRVFQPDEESRPEMRGMSELKDVLLALFLVRISF